MMLGHYGRLALRRMRRAPGQTLLMVGAIALGVGTCVVMLTVYDALAHNPIWWKSDRLFAVTIDSWDPNQPYDPGKPDLPPPELAYKDAVALLHSNIPTHAAAMARMLDVVSPTAGGTRNIPIATRVTGGDFFRLFDVPFLYGSGWSARDDDGPGNAIVLSRTLNERLFGGANSVGKTVFWDGKAMRVIGVLDAWHPLPKFYDLTRGAFDGPEDAYVPFGWARVRGRIPDGGPVACWQNAPITSFEQFLHSDCVWLQMWVELDDASAVERMQRFLDGYWADQRGAGRFPRPRNNRLTDVSRWLVDQRVVPNDNRVLVGVAAAFLAICLLNAAALLLSQFLKGAHAASVRRALGASRGQIVLQHLTEAGVIAAAGGVLGLAVSALGLYGVHALYARGSIGPDGYQRIVHLSPDSLVWALALSALCTLAVGLYPAWRVGVLAPAAYLKED